MLIAKAQTGLESPLVDLDPSLRALGAHVLGIDDNLAFDLIGGSHDVFDRGGGAELHRVAAPCVVDAELDGERAGRDCRSEKEGKQQWAHGI